ncbi:MAG TPA: tetratricopeptide repeat protein, partial [Polyangiales bacterium]|nr:tetratricopeptide repeat protein [Polyangiales bacterium]
ADDEESFVATLRRGIKLHPGEPSLALLAGAYAGAKRHPDAPRWLAIVMQEAPDWGMPHAIAADWLETAGQLDQALLEVREAERRRAGSAADVMCRILAKTPKMEHLQRAAPPEDARIGFFNRTVGCRGLSAATIAEIDRLILEESPTHPDASLRESNRLMNTERTTEAVELLERSLAANPRHVRLWTTLMNAHLRNQDASKAMSLVEQASSAGLDSHLLEEARARIEAALGQTNDMRATITRLRGQSMGDIRKVAATFMLEGELEASLGNVDEALAAYAAADAASPETPGLQRAAELALRSGRSSHARRIYGTLCSRNPGGPACAQEERLAKELRRATPRPALP